MRIKVRILHRVLAYAFHSDIARAFSLVSFYTQPRVCSCLCYLIEADISGRTLSGPIFGGILARPENRWPTMFPPGYIWSQFPFLLPNVVVAALIATTAGSGVILLPETNSKHSHCRLQWSILSNSITSLLARLRGERNKTYMNLAQQADSEDRGTLAGPNSAVELQQWTVGEITSVEAELDKIEQSSSDYTGRTFTNKVIMQIVTVSLLAFHKVSADVLGP